MRLQIEKQGETGAAYRRFGYHVERQVLSPAECETLRTRGMALLEAGPTPNRLMQPHRTEATFMQIFRDPRLVAPLRALAEESLVGVQTMFYIKPAGSTGHGWHQDNHYITGRPKPVMAAWCALERITAENGGLTVYPGSHLDGRCLEMVPHDDPNFQNHARIVLPPPGIEPVLVEMQAGDVLFFDGYLVHGSYPNRSQSDTRTAFIAHYMPTGSLLPDTHGDRVAI
jgi:ectoine hydroxylase-related dioxygenase (phytanoyl-CoA dioxygenase family)